MTSVGDFMALTDGVAWMSVELLGMSLFGRGARWVIGLRGSGSGSTVATFALFGPCL